MRDWFFLGVCAPGENRAGRGRGFASKVKRYLDTYSTLHFGFDGGEMGLARGVGLGFGFLVLLFGSRAQLVHAGGGGPVTVPQAPTVAPPATPPATPSVPQNPSGPHPLTAADLETFFDGILPLQLERSDIAGASVLVMKDGNALLQKGYGYADVKTKKRSIRRPPSFGWLRSPSCSHGFR